MASLVFDLFSIGIGPSSSHTVGPMRAARAFASELKKLGLLNQTYELAVELYGALAATGRGHGTDRAILAGLSGQTPQCTDSKRIESCIERVSKTGVLTLLEIRDVDFDASSALLWRPERNLKTHPNGMVFHAFGPQGQVLHSEVYFSVGGGAILKGQHDISKSGANNVSVEPFESAKELLDVCAERACNIAYVMLSHELKFRGEEQITRELLDIWRIMNDSIDHGLHTDGVLPGALQLPRRAGAMWRKLNRKSSQDHVAPDKTHTEAIDRVNVYAMAVGEENAAGGRIVTAPTNGAAGIIPAVIRYALEFCKHDDSPQGIIDFLLTAAAIGSLYKRNASISGAAVGCQGEIGVACSMAAAGLTAYMGGTPAQVENAAEIAMEHNLGLTCDPVAGLVQVPCIERNAMGAVKAMNAARLALQGDGHHFVSLDKVIKTMRETGEDMKAQYKETALAGLAVNVIEC